VVEREFHAGLIVQKGDPLGELLGVGDGRRQKDKAYLVGQHDDGFLPDDAALWAWWVSERVQHGWMGKGVRRVRLNGRGEKQEVQ